MRSRKCIVVLGLHRSGTSALTRILKKCGVYLGETRRPIDESQKESFENVKVSNFNTKMLAKYNYIWSDLVPTIAFDDEDVKHLKEVITSEFSRQDLFAIKEPGIVYLFPLYEKVFKDLGIEINFLLLYRNPLEVAQALLNRDGFSEYKGVFLWLYNFLLGEKYSRQYIRGLINFEDLINDTGAVVKQIGKILSISTDEQRQLDGLLKSRFRRNVNESELKKYADLWLPTIVGQMKHFGDSSQTRLYDNIMQHIVEKIDFIDQIQANHSDFWRIQTQDKIQELKALRIQWQLKDEELQIKKYALHAKEEELEIKSRVLEEKEDNIITKNDDLYIKERELLAKDDESQLKLNALEAKLQQLNEKDQAFQAKDNQLVAKDQELQDKDRVLHESENDLLAKFHELKAKNAEIQARDQEIKDKMLKLEKELELLRHKERELTTEQASFAEISEKLHQKEQQLEAKESLLQSREADLDEKEHDMLVKIEELEEKANRGFFSRIFRN